MKTLSQVIDLLLTEIPVKETGLINQLKTKQASSVLPVPKNNMFWWVKTAEVLIDYIKYPKEIWERKVVEIWFNHTERFE